MALYSDIHMGHKNTTRVHYKDFIIESGGRRSEY